MDDEAGAAAEAEGAREDDAAHEKPPEIVAVRGLLTDRAGGVVVMVGTACDPSLAVAVDGLDAFPLGGVTPTLVNDISVVGL